MNKIYEFFGGRKFFFALLSFIVLSVLTYFGKVNNDGFIYGMIFLNAVYQGANVYQKKVLNDGTTVEVGTRDNSGENK